MALPEARKGTSSGFHCYSITSLEGTLGEPEKIIWASIRYMCVQDRVDEILYSAHNITSKRERFKISHNLRLYISQAYEFYQAALSAKSNAAPLFYYYSFLNLAKSLCEIRYPDFHKKPECYSHGLSWKPSRDYLVDMYSECISISTRGVWHVLLESIQKQPFNIQNPIKLKIKDLFALCPGIATEYEINYQESTRLIELIEPDVLYDTDTNEIWIRFFIEKREIKKFKLSRPKFLELITYKDSKYKYIKSKEWPLWTFELERPKKFSSKYKGNKYDLIIPEIKAMNLFTYLILERELCYSVPIQTRLPIRLPQLLVLYSLVFWFGSLVRYDPHSVEDLQNSGFWILIDGFMNQSRIWLLELFE